MFVVLPTRKKKYISESTESDRKHTWKDIHLTSGLSVQYRKDHKNGFFCFSLEKFEL